MYGERPSVLEGVVAWTGSGDDGDGLVLPDGCMDLLWLDDHLAVAGPDTGAYVSGRRDGARYAGLRFAPGLGPAVIGVAAHELRDQRVPLEAIWKSEEARRLADQVAASERPVEVLEAAVARRVDDADPDLQGVAGAVEAGMDVSTIAADLGLSARQLHRRSLSTFGYGPKMLDRVLRLQRALRLARAGVPFATTAATAGYADQAHLARDVRDLTGSTLTQLTAPA